MRVEVRDHLFGIGHGRQGQPFILPEQEVVLHGIEPGFPEGFKHGVFGPVFVRFFSLERRELHGQILIGVKQVRRIDAFIHAELGIPMKNISIEVL